MFVENVGSPVTLRLIVKLAQTMNRHKITDSAEVEAVVEITEEVGIAAV